MKLTDLVALSHPRINKLFQTYLAEPPLTATRLQQAMNYSVLNGGKLLRPLLVYATGLTLDADLENLDPPACAVELIHAYSLVHDDLPAMDNADLRRGKPTCHKAFDEAMAILVGDALQPLAFQILATHPASLSSEQRVQMIKILSAAIGANGMVGGQVLDIEGTDQLDEMYHLKTGALLNASVELGAIAAGVQDPAVLNNLETFINNIGLAFQIQDDLLDFEKEDISGKSQGLDVKNNKLTYPILLGITATRKKITTLLSNALDALTTLGEKKIILEQLAQHIIK